MSESPPQFGDVFHDVANGLDIVLLKAVKSSEGELSWEHLRIPCKKSLLDKSVNPCLIVDPKKVIFHKWCVRNKTGKEGQAFRRSLNKAEVEYLRFELLSNYFEDVNKDTNTKIKPKNKSKSFLDGIL